LGRRGVVWDREGEERMRVIQRKGKGREEGKGREGKGREKGRRRKMTCPPPQKKKNSWIRHWSFHMYANFIKRGEHRSDSDAATLPLESMYPRREV
jgi:hypothetical protein